MGYRNRWKRNYYAKPRNVTDRFDAAKWTKGKPFASCIPVTWKGRQYRSKAEGRVAVFLHHARIASQYEMESFEIKAESGEIIRYMPDFFLPDFNKWLEVKAKYLTPNDPDYCKVIALDRAAPLGAPILTTWGIDSTTHWRTMGKPNPTHKNFYEESYQFGFCSVCKQITLFLDKPFSQQDREVDGNCVKCGTIEGRAYDEKYYNLMDNLRDAWIAAREETFGL